MKGSLKLRPRRALNRAEAWACFTANLALPGSGSLAAGRKVGYGQLAAAFLATTFTFVTAIPLFKWILAGGGAAPPLGGDDLQHFVDMWMHVRWPLASIGLFAGSILWALMTSLAILANAPKQAVPPRITG